MDIRDILFWIFLVIGMILLIWSVFGDSPTEIVTIGVLIFTVLFKTWSISDRQIKSDMKFNLLARDFRALAKDFKEHIKHK